MSPALAPEAIPVTATAPAARQSPFASVFRDYLDAGFTPIPLRPREKVPGLYQGNIGSGTWGLMSSWDDAAKQRPGPLFYDRWALWPDANVGIVLGTKVGDYIVIAIDFDTADPAELGKLSAALPPSPMVKVGARGFTAFYLAPPSVTTKRFPVPDPQPGAPSKKRMLLEVLSLGRQTACPPSIHPDTGAAYAWKADRGLVPAHGLPILTADHMAALGEVAGTLGWQPSIAPAASVSTAPRGAAGTAISAVSGTTSDDPNIWRATNNVALANPDSWFLALGLAKAKKIGLGQYAAVASFRASLSGKAEVARERNLKLHPAGIKDWTTGVGYTPLDLVLAALGCDFDTAFRWLRSKLSMDDDGDLPDTLPLRPRHPQVVEAANGILADADSGEVFASEAVVVSAAELPDALTRIPGLLGDVVDFIDASARRPNRVLSLGAAVTMMGTLIGRRDATPTKSGTHLYVLALAPSGAGKQHGIDAVMALTRAANADRHVEPGEFMSQSALLARMEFEPLTLSVADEFGAFFQKLNSPRAGAWERGIKKTLRSAWGSSFKTLATPSLAQIQSVRIEAPALSIYGPSTPAEFYAAVQGDDVVNGMLNRFLLLSTAKRSRNTDPVESLDAIPEALVDRLCWLYQERRPLIPLLTEDPVAPFVVPWGVGAKAVFDALAEHCERLGDEDEAVEPYYARTAEMAVRLATIRAVGLDVEHPSVSVADIEWGRDLALWSAQRMAADAGDFVSDGEVGRIRGKILRKLREAKGRPVRDRDLCLALHMRSKDVIEHMCDLELAGRVVRRQIVGRGRPSYASVLIANDN